MTLMQAAAFQHEPLAPPSDAMEMGTSPLIHADDVDFELDDIDAHFVDNDKSMIDDQFDFFDDMQNDSRSTHQAQDHQMIDDQQQQQQQQSNHSLDEQSYADDDILLDDDYDQHHEDTEVQVESAEHGHQIETGQSDHAPKRDTESISLQQDEDNPTNQDTNQTAHHNTPPETDSATLNRSNSETDTAAAPTNGHQIEPAQSNDPAEDTAYDTPAPLHPVLVTFDNEERLLFPSTDEESALYLLEDESLASESCQVLLAACRECLKDRMEHNDEVVLEIPKLGLQICEDSKYTSALTLARIIDTYMLLKQNEELSTIDPLECRLSYRPCLETQMNWLITSATEGKTFSEIAADYDLVESEYSAEEADVADEAEAHPDILPSRPADAELGHEDEYEHEPDAQPETIDEATEDTGHIEVPAADEDEADPHTADLVHDQEHPDAATSPPITTDTLPEGDTTGDSHPQQASARAGEDVFTEESHVELGSDTKQAPQPDPAVALPVPDSEPAEALVDEVEHVEADQDDIVELDLISDDDEDPSEDHITTASEAPVLLTPSKSLNGKRKTFDHTDDDEDLLLDISTPEPKRQRAS